MDGSGEKREPEQRSGRAVAGATIQTLLALGSFCAVWLILAVRGSADWSDNLAGVFYTMLTAAFALSLTGCFSALASRTITRPARWFSISVGIAIPAVIILVGVAVVEALSHLN